MDQLSISMQLPSPTCITSEIDSPVKCCWSSRASHRGETCIRSYPKGQRATSSTSDSVLANVPAGHPTGLEVLSARW
ncbi:hypothetical protein VFPPC_16594 [Pochonia chlamydosporia 170]|uniref:Uncharacterized protein n=1 Tax=Pochonia chlamydosporia 170 TaxID=1380566 RepID=A0A179F9E4_METCM|nr:hypothetical protein VFPPC_16594 [Pochonia chlamydosporia 170]OAQ62017.1 hypothetical protein VFPPC_16594 [Pochonia chlamydosporia 170]